MTQFESVLAEKETLAAAQQGLTSQLAAAQQAQQVRSSILILQRLI